MAQGVVPVLRSFRLGNHRSFRDEQELSLLPAYDREQAALPVVAIYGANASGKSNVLNGLAFMRRAVVESFQRWDLDSGVARNEFRLDTQAQERPSTFVVDMVVDNVRHTYGFTADDRHILDEWLYSYPNRRKRVLFERTHDDIEFGSTMTEQRAKLDVLEELTRPNALFLSVAAQSNVEQLISVYRWFRSDIRLRLRRPFRQDHDIAARLAGLSGTRPEDVARLFTLLRAADVGISNLDVVQMGDTTDRRDSFRVIFQHAGSDEVFQLHEESEGTRAWLDLLLVVIDVLHDGAAFVVDEIDASLHPLLTARLVGLFRDPETNPNGAQLVFTTHDASLLGTMLGEEVLARDQVWFVEKDESGASTLYPLTDFKPRTGENTERRYLGGSYGAVPVLDPHDFTKAMRGA